MHERAFPPEATWPSRIIASRLWSMNLFRSPPRTAFRTAGILADLGPQSNRFGVALLQHLWGFAQQMPPHHDYLGRAGIYWQAFGA
jgi:hypothetical protein